MLIPRRDAVRQHGKVGFSASRGDSTFPAAACSRDNRHKNLPDVRAEQGALLTLTVPLCLWWGKRQLSFTILALWAILHGWKPRVPVLQDTQGSTRAAWVRGIFLSVGRRIWKGEKPMEKKSVRFERHPGLPGPLKLDPAAVHCFSGGVAGHPWHSRNKPGSSCWQQSPSQRLERLWKLIYRHRSLWASIAGLNLMRGLGKTHRLWLSRQAFIKCTVCKRERSGQTVLLGLE